MINQRNLRDTEITMGMDGEEGARIKNKDVPELIMVKASRQAN
jgi:hypothetical protein